MLGSRELGSVSEREAPASRGTLKTGDVGGPPKLKPETKEHTRCASERRLFVSRKAKTMTAEIPSQEKQVPRVYGPHTVSTTISTRTYERLTFLAKMRGTSRRDLMSIALTEFAE